MTTLAAQSLGSAQKGVYVMQSLMKGKDIFKAQQIYIYMKTDKGVVEIKFCYLMFSCDKGSSRACEESYKACEESVKAPCENTSKPPFRKITFGKRFLLFQKIFY